MDSSKIPVIKEETLDNFLEGHLERCTREIENLVTSVKKIDKACFTAAMLNCRLAGLEKAWDEANARHGIILATVGITDRNKLEYFQQDYMARMQDIVYNARDFFNEELSKLTPAASIIREKTIESFIEGHLETCTREIENLVTNVKIKASFTVPMLTGRLTALEKAWDEAKARHETILASASVTDRNNLEYFDQDYMATMQDFVYEARDFFNEELAKLKSSQSSQALVAQSERSVVAVESPQAVQSLQVTESAPSVRITHCYFDLPELKIPRFDGDPLEWYSFRDIFTAVIINNRTLSDTERLIYLLNFLDGTAYQSISYTRICDENFKVAWRTLERRFEQKRIVLRSLLTPLRELGPITKDDLASIEQVTIFIWQTVKSVEIKWKFQVEHWSVLLVDWITEKLDRTLRLEWEESIVNNDDFPTFEMLVQFLRRHADALRSIQAMREISERPRNKRNRSRRNFTPRNHS